MRRAAVISVIAALALPAAAGAKEISAVSVCGTNGCRTIADRDALRSFMNDANVQVAPSNATPFLRLRVKVTHDGEDLGGWTAQWMRPLNLIRAEGDTGSAFSRPDAATTRALRHAARGLKPYPATELAPVREPSSVPVAAAPAPASRQAADGGSSAVAWIVAGGALALIAAASGALIARRRRRGPSASA
jgi:hypothetical protein